MKERSSGAALVAALVLVVVVGLLVLVTALLALSARRLSRDGLQTTQAQLAAESAVERAVYDLWTRRVDAFLAERPPGHIVTTAELRALLEGRLRPDDAPWRLHGERYDRASRRWVCPEGRTCRVALSPPTLGEGVRGRVQIRRRDSSPSVTRFDLDAVGEAGGATRRVLQSLVLRPRAPAGGFALLVERTGCSYCHTLVTSLEAAYDPATSTLARPREAIFPNAEGTGRVRVGHLADLPLVRPDLDSWITGTLYARTAPGDVAGAGVVSQRFDDEDGVLDGTLAADSAPLEGPDCAGGPCPPFARLYTNYPSGDGPDGTLPPVLPVPVPDADDDRWIDHAEWRAAVGAEEPGSLSGGEALFVPTDETERVGTTARGPVVRDVLVPSGSAPPRPVEPDAARVPGRGVPGSLILRGSDADPLRLDGSVFVEGDLVVSGRVTGRGRLVARGNVYVTGDLVAWCEDGKGADHACDHARPDGLPEVGLLAAGNLLVGPFGQTKGGRRAEDRACLRPPASACTLAGPYGGGERPTDVAGNTDRTGPEDLDPGLWLGPDGELADAVPPPAYRAADVERAARRRAAWTPEERARAGRATAVGDLAGGPLRGTRASFAALQAASFNELEYRRALASPGHVPRFYRLGADAGVFRCAGTGAVWGCRWYGDPADADEVVLRASDHPGLAADARVRVAREAGALSRIDEALDPVFARAVVVDLSPLGRPDGSTWLTPGSDDPLDARRVLEARWAEGVERGSRPDGEALRIDALLFAGHGLFGFLPAASRTRGRLVVNGGIVAADLGLLAPGTPDDAPILREAGEAGLRVHHDARLGFLLGGPAAPLVLVREAYRPVAR